MESAVTQAFLEMKAQEYGGDAALLRASENSVLPAGDADPFFKVITFGSGAVARVRKEALDSVAALLSRHEGPFCFDAPLLCLLNEVLREHGSRLGELYDTFLPSRVDQVDVNYEGNLRVVHLNSEDIETLDHPERYENALSLTPGSAKNELAYAAFDKEVLAAIAACSSNTEKFWSVGVDTEKSFRGHGLGTLLTSLVSKEILRLGRYPMYSTWCGNIASRTVAINCGFRPCCVEIAAEEDP